MEDVGPAPGHGRGVADLQDEVGAVELAGSDDRSGLGPERFGSGPQRVDERRPTVWGSGFDARHERRVVGAEANSRDDRTGPPGEQGDQEPRQVLHGRLANQGGVYVDDDSDRAGCVSTLLVQARNREKMPPLGAAPGVGAHFVLL